MPESPYIQQLIAAKKQAQQAKNSKTIAVNFAMEMERIIHARQLEEMRGSLGV